MDEVAGYFNESIFYAEDLKPNESYTKYLYFLYDSNGNYIIEFNKEHEHTKVVLNIKRKSDLKNQENYYYENNNNFI